MQKPSASTLIPILIIVSIIAGGLYFLFKPQDDAIRQVNNSQPTAHTSIVVTTENHQPAPTNEAVNNDNNQQEPSNYRRAPIEATRTDPCLDAIKQLDSFFLYLDTQEYIKDYQFPDGSKDFIASMINKALAHPPIHTKEGSLRDKVKTGAHLYRTIGGQNLLILAQIISNEPDHMENVFKDFYNWSFIAGQCPNRTYTIRPQLDQLYLYALFFIDSQDGKTYVNRRDTMIGLLTRFYALQVIKEAQVQHIDQYNIETIDHITSLITDIESTDLLAQKTTYLETLYSLRDE